MKRIQEKIKKLCDDCGPFGWEEEVVEIVDEEEDLGEEEGEDNRNIKSIGIFNSTEIFVDLKVG